MAKDSLLTNDESVIDGALERFERAEAELGEVEERRKHAVDEAARAAAELDSVVNESVQKAIVRRDQLEEELAAVVDHIARLEAMRSRPAAQASTLDAPVTGPVAQGDEVEQGSADDDAAAYEDSWYEQLKSRNGKSAFTS